MSAALWVPWIVAFLLEGFGACMAWSRRLTPIFWFLTFSAFADIVKASVRLTFGGYAYGVTFWICFAIEYIFMVTIASAIIGQLVDESDRGKVTGAAVFFSVVGGAVAASLFSSGVTLADKLLDAELACNILILVMVAVGWVTRAKRLQGSWSWIAAGLLVRVSMDLICTLLWKEWTGAQAFYAIGEIAALLLWIAGPATTMRWPDWNRQRLLRKMAAGRNEERLIVLD